MSDIYFTVTGGCTTALTFCPITEKNAYLSHHPCIDYSSPEATSYSRIGIESLQNCKALLNFACESIRLWDSFSIALIIYCPESWSSLHYSNSSEEVFYCTGNVFWSVHWNQLQWECEVFSIFSVLICIISLCFWWHTRCEICWATNDHFMMMSCKVSKNPAWLENDPRYRSACPPRVMKRRGYRVLIADSAFATVISTTSHTYL